MFWVHVGIYFAPCDFKKQVKHSLPGPGALKDCGTTELFNVPRADWSEDVLLNSLTAVLHRELSVAAMERSRLGYMCVNQGCRENFG